MYIYIECPLSYLSILQYKSYKSNKINKIHSLCSLEDNNLIDPLFLGKTADFFVKILHTNVHVVFNLIVGWFLCQSTKKYIQIKGFLIVFIIFLFYSFLSSIICSITHCVCLYIHFWAESSILLMSTNTPPPLFLISVHFLFSCLF